MPRENEQPRGVAALADRPVDGRRIARVLGLLGFVLAALASGSVELLLQSANAEGEGGRLLRRHPFDFAAPDGRPHPLAVVLVDGLRADEARRLSSWRELAPGSTTGTLAIPTPSLSRPFYHLLLTGVPSAASGVRSNRFHDHARHDSVADRVREAGGAVTFLSEGLDWMRTMHGRPGDGGSDDAGALRQDELARRLADWRGDFRPTRPSLLVVHVTAVDHTAHEEGIEAAAHADALRRADRVILQVARRGTALVVLSDHGHLRRGGHGGPEPEVTRAPLLIRGLGSRALAHPVPARRLAATMSALLGVPSPHSAIGAALVARVPTEDAGAHARLADIAQQARHVDEARLSERRTRTLPLVVLALVMMLGPIKRAYGFDRSVPLALVTWPATVLGLHLALGRPLSLSAIDTVRDHVLRVAAIGLLATALAFLCARVLGRGDPPARTRRAAACVGWAAFATALLALAQAGFALGPWPLSPRAHYLPLLFAGAAAPSLVLAGVILLVSASVDRSGSRSRERAGASGSA